MENGDSAFDRISWHLPPDTPEKMQCMKYLAVAFGCSMPKQHFRMWYAEGKGSDCGVERSNFYSCVQYKVGNTDRRRKILEDNHKLVEERMRSPFFSLRQGPPPSWPKGEFDPVAYAEAQNPD